MNLPISKEDIEDYTLSRKIIQAVPYLPFRLKVAASGDVQTYQIRTAPTSTIAPGVVMASSPALPTQPAEEAARKREVRLMKNREAARECRRKKKEYVKCLENRVAVLENQNKTLIEELKALKDLYCHKSD
ncbi:Cyclic Amp-Responsive Element-Binding Protein 1 [Manis pentadactyla]|nr:Cyclic Amp-Responsive Element-Binding Protein 1 [Manis pentadactyla]